MPQQGATTRGRKWGTTCGTNRTEWRTPMTASTRFLALALPLLIAAGCVDETTEDSTTADTAAASGTEGVDPPEDLDPMCEPNAGDGTTQCGGNICEGGMRCENSAAGTCSAGCESTLNCPANQWCDLRAPDAWGAGLCRPTSDPACGGPGESGADDSSGSSDEIVDCLDVEGNYTLEADGGQPEVCQDFFSDGTICSVAQEGCTLTWGCGDGVDTIVPFPAGDLQGDDSFSADGTTPEGFAFSCTFDFADFPMRWSCSFGAGGGAIVCQGSGT